jgi:hypothetical protein
MFTSIEKLFCTVCSAQIHPKAVGAAERVFELDEVPVGCYKFSSKNICSTGKCSLKTLLFTTAPRVKKSLY